MRVFIGTILSFIVLVLASVNTANVDVVSTTSYEVAVEKIGEFEPKTEPTPDSSILIGDAIALSKKERCLPHLDLSFSLFDLTQDIFRPPSFS
jgi:hypothetical protein